MNDRTLFDTSTDAGAVDETPDATPDYSFDQLRAYALKRQRRKCPGDQVLEVIDHQHRAIFHIRRHRGSDDSMPRLGDAFGTALLDGLCDDAAVIHLTAAPDRRIVIDGLGRTEDAVSLPDDLGHYTLLGLLA